MIGNDAFQEVDITGITIPITKHNYLVQEPCELPHVVEEAFYLAGSGRPGPVLIDVPRDVQQEEFSPHQAKFPQLEGYKPTLEGHPGQIKRAAALLKGAQQPLIVAGGGRIPGRRRAGAAPAGREGRHPGGPYPDGQGLLSQLPSPVPGPAGLPRPRGGQYGGFGGRRDPGGGHPPGRPQHGAAGHFRPPGPHHPRRHRPGGDQQERPGLPPDRRATPGAS